MVKKLKEEHGKTCLQVISIKVYITVSVYMNERQKRKRKKNVNTQIFFSYERKLVTLLLELSSVIHA